MSDTQTPSVLAPAPKKNTDVRGQYALVGQASGKFDGKIYESLFGAKRAQGRFNDRKCEKDCNCTEPELLDLVPVTLTFGPALRKGERPATQPSLPGTEPQPEAPASAPVEA